MNFPTELECPTTAVVHGAPLRCTLRVFNPAEQVAEFTAAAVGEAAGWLSAEPQRLRLMPETDGEVNVALTVPRDAALPAGAHDITVEIASSLDDVDTQTETMTVEVPEVTEVRLEVDQPSDAQSAGRYTVRVHNDGNHPASVQLTADAETGVVVEFDPATVQVPPFAAPRESRVRVRDERDDPQPTTITVQARSDDLQRDRAIDYVPPAQPGLWDQWKQPLHTDWLIWLGALTVLPVLTWMVFFLGLGVPSPQLLVLLAVLAVDATVAVAVLSRRRDRGHQAALGIAAGVITAAVLAGWLLVTRWPPVLEQVTFNTSVGTFPHEVDLDGSGFADLALRLEPSGLDEVPAVVTLGRSLMNLMPDGAATGFAGCPDAPVGGGAVAIPGLSPGDHLCVRTTVGTVVDLEILEAPGGSSGPLTFRYTAWGWSWDGLGCTTEACR